MASADPIHALKERGFCLLSGHYPEPLIRPCREATLLCLDAYLAVHHDAPNRGPHRHFMPMPFDPPCFDPRFFFDDAVLGVARSAMGERIVIDQWGCDTPVRGSENQGLHLDYRRPLFEEAPDLPLPPHALVVSIALTDITPDHGPIAIAPGTHALSRDEAAAIERGDIAVEPVLMQAGDVLIRHPWALHRGTPNTTDTPRPLISLRYVRHWYRDDSRDVMPIPPATWRALSPEQQALMRFPLAAAD